MAKYVIESPHTIEECKQAIDDILEMNLLDKFVFGCKSGEHTGWAYIDADSEKDALNNVPEFIRDKACAFEVSKFTAEELRTAH